eukprot:COSAG05_NODE_15_length_36348_cov_78.369307_7_plen_400_part_00
MLHHNARIVVGGANSFSVAGRACIPMFRPFAARPELCILLLLCRTASAQSSDASGSWESTCDQCGRCDSDPSNDCVADCNGVWGGPAEVDPCGRCDDDPDNDCHDMAAFAGTLADHMSGPVGFFVDTWPHFATGASLLCALYVTFSVFLQNEQESSQLETVYSVAAACSGCAALLMLTAIRVEARDTAPGWFCQAQGAAVTYFHLATVLWLTAGSHCVYRFVIHRNASDTILLTLKSDEDREQAKQLQGAIGFLGKVGLASPHAEPRAMKLMVLYSVICCGVPCLAVGLMLFPGLNKSPAFSYQRLHTTGWCTLNMAAALRSFFFFYMPFMACMFYTAAAYFFCWNQVKAKRGLVSQIENEILYDAGAKAIRERYQDAFDSNSRASNVVRMTLIATSLC